MKSGFNRRSRDDSNRREPIPALKGRAKVNRRSATKKERINTFLSVLYLALHHNLRARKLVRPSQAIADLRQENNKSMSSRLKVLFTTVVLVFSSVNFNNPAKAQRAPQVKTAEKAAAPAEMLTPESIASVE